jgi:hypothetical protein
MITNNDLTYASWPAWFCAGVTAGYGDEVIFADGTFIDGSTAELSADGPLRAPYVVYCQGGAHWTHWALALESAVRSMASAGLLPQQQEHTAASGLQRLEAELQTVSC